jgi:hypothetical protein
VTYVDVTNVPELVVHTTRITGGGVRISSTEVRAMTPTMWSNDITGERLDADELARLRAKAHVLYEANVHIFEDELDALAALGAISVVEYAA